MEDSIQIRYNIMDIFSLQAFAQISGGYRNYCKDVYFIRFCGMNETFVQDVSNIHHQLQERMAEQRGFYQYIAELPKLCQSEDIAFYSECYQNWLTNDKRVLDLKYHYEDNLLKERMNQAFIEAGKYLDNENSSIQKNFYVKLMCWFDYVVGEAFLKWQPQMSMKVLASQIVKKQEYLFLYLLTQCGVDVLLLQNEQDIVIDENLQKLTKKYVIGNYGKFSWKEWLEKENYDNQIQKREIVHNVYKIQEKGTVQETQTNGSVQNKAGIPEKRRSVAERTEKTYEELARLASSIVMINIYNEGGDIIGGGSGIMIGSEGYILTNYHVAAAGRYYSVQIENEENAYPSTELIKYNAQYDLAIIRIQRKLNPLPIYQGSQKLVRGQKVVAIGSPLGFFNTVSDGIISGFRKMKNREEQLWDSIEMIQFTAPISEGSSGGAVLNMYGEVIGITTGGTNIGQNINLAVGYQDILNFVQGFIR